MVEKDDCQVIQCPTCMEEHKFNINEDIDKQVATNHSLLQKLRQNREHKNDNHQLGNMRDDDHEDENFNIELEPNAMCSKHSKPIHSYVKSNKALLCSKCIEVHNYDESKYKPITQVVKETKGLMNSYKLKLNQGLLQLKRFKEDIENMKEENRK